MKKYIITFFKELNAFKLERVIKCKDNFQKSINSPLTFGKTMQFWNDPFKLLEPSHTYQEKITSGFFEKYLGGKVVLDIGYKGGKSDAVPILPHAVGVDFDYPGYDGRQLPFNSDSVDSIYTSHCLEHIADYAGALIEWMRVIKPFGYIVIVVPHMHFYERKALPPSNWNLDHKRFYTPSRLLREIEETLNPHGYKLVHACDNRNMNFNYTQNLDQHAHGPYEVEVVLQKLTYFQ